MPLYSVSLSSWGGEGRCFFFHGDIFMVIDE
jgi:hypothetical protein